MKVVLDHPRGFSSLYGACQAIGPKVDIGSESMGNWTRQAHIDAKQVSGAMSDKLQRIKEFERENRDPNEADDISKSASILRERARSSPPLRARCDLIQVGAQPGRFWHALVPDWSGRCRRATILRSGLVCGIRNLVGEA